MNDLERGIKTYMIYGMYDNMNGASFNQYLLDGVDILSYWNHIPLLYFIKTRCTVSEIAFKVRPFFGGSWYMVQEVVPGAADGWLPAAAWEWFVKPAPDSKTTSPNKGMGDLFAILPPPPSKY